MVWRTSKEKIRELSEELVSLQGPIRILDSIKIHPSIGAKFKASKYREIPALGPKSYDTCPLPFDPKAKIAELNELSKKIDRELGASNDIGALLSHSVLEYQTVVEMLQARGTKNFYEYSRRLYGSSKSKLLSDKNTVIEMSQLLYGILGGIKATMPSRLADGKTISASNAVKALRKNLKKYFGDEVNVILSDGIVADASAGGDTVKINSESKFSSAEILALEVHEGWVHVGTTLNGRNQTCARWLTVGPPRCTSTQEGLATLVEILTFRSSVKRAQRINDRILAISKAEEGANLLEVFEFFRTEGYSEEECMTNSFRVFRGSHFEGGAPFTKDISYCVGFIEVYNFMRAAIRAGLPSLIPYLFCGKVHVEDVPLLHFLHREGIVDLPKYLPERFRDIEGLAVWMSFSSFFNRVDLASVQAHYNKLFKRYG